MPRKEARVAAPPLEAGDGDVSLLAESIFHKVRRIKRENPEVSRRIDQLEREIRTRVEMIRKEIDRLDRRNQDLVTILVINGIQRTAEEVLVR